MKATLNDLLNAKGVSEPLREAVKALINRLEAAEKELVEIRHGAAVANDTIKALRAKITEMGRQEPVAWAATDETKTVVEALGMNQSRRFDSPLFLAPGAQPTPSVPEKIKRAGSGFKGMFLREAQAYKQGWNECRAAMLAAAPKPEGE